MRAGVSPNALPQWEGGCHISAMQRTIMVLHQGMR